MSKKILLLLLLLPISIKATCTSSDMARYKTLSSEINTYLMYNEQNKTFNIKIYNLSNNFELININNRNSYKTNDTIGETTIDNQTPGQLLTLGVYPISGECKEYRIRTIYVNIPYLNKYYQDEICNNNDNTLCSKWTNTDNYTYEQFIESVKNTKKQNNEEEKEPEPEMKRHTFLDFLGDYYIVILLVIIASGSVAIYILDKKSKFDF